MNVSGQIRDIGGRLEVFWDDWLIAERKEVTLKLHQPVAQEVVMEFNLPWEGSTSAYVTVFADGNLWRMYYRGSNYDCGSRKATHPEFTCYAESSDGINWRKPELGLIEFNGSRKNNIIWENEIGSHNFTPFKDTNPRAKKEERYKAVGVGKGGIYGLYGFASSDGIHWRLFKNSPLISSGAFDSQNTVFYDRRDKIYRAYLRGWTGNNFQGIRTIRLSTSRDFENWSEPEFLSFKEAGQEHLYTNAITPYFRAEHFYVGFPMRFVPERHKTQLHPFTGVSDAVFITSRDGKNWYRWPEAFLKPGLQPERWINRNNMISYGLVITRSKLNPAVEEISLYSSEGYYTEKNRLRRYTLRMDGFISLSTCGKQGQVLTQPLLFQGRNLVLNYSTSAAGWLRVEIQDEGGKTIPGYAATDCLLMYGDSTNEIVTWNSGSDLSHLEGKPVRLKFILQEAELYSLQFRGKEKGENGR